MNLFNFIAHFVSEECCISHFKEERDKTGVIYNCGCKNHSGLKVDRVTNIKSIKVEFH